MSDNGNWSSEDYKFYADAQKRIRFEEQQHGQMVTGSLDYYDKESEDWEARYSFRGVSGLTVKGRVGTLPVAADIFQKGLVHITADNWQEIQDKNPGKTPFVYAGEPEQIIRDWKDREKQKNQEGREQSEDAQKRQNEDTQEDQSERFGEDTSTEKERHKQEKRDRKG